MRASAASGLIVLCAAMTLLAGCGGSDSSKPSQADMTTMAEKPPTVVVSPFNAQDIINKTAGHASRSKGARDDLAVPRALRFTGAR